ncbi:MAG: class I SAM-dependent methyltransferase [Caldilineaceae bacterium]|nr:class I SAM-dependent methyltransferase [Caldilineaceae bacterium]
MRLSDKEVNVEARIMVPRLSWVARAYQWACARLYLELAWAYDWVSWLVSGGHWRRWQAGVWAEVRGQDVLELGVGTGELLVQGSQRRFSMVGVDRSPTMIEVTRRRAVQKQVGVRAILSDGRALPFQDEVFDTVMATFPAGYILEAATLAEMRRVLRRGGRVVLLGLWVELQFGWMGRMLPVFYGRPAEASLTATAERLAAAGFEARWVEQQDGPFTVGVLVADRE